METFVALGYWASIIRLHNKLLPQEPSSSEGRRTEPASSSTSTQNRQIIEPATEAASPLEQQRSIDLRVTPNYVKGSSPVSALPSSSATRDAKDEARISGSMKEVVFLKENTDGVSWHLYVAINLHIENDGHATKLQEFRLKFSFPDRTFDQITSTSLDSFKLTHFGDGNRLVEQTVFTDLRAENEKPFERQFPRDGWLCFDVHLGLPGRKFDPDNEYVLRLIQLTVEIVDGVNNVHPIIQGYPFPIKRMLVRKS